jgi:hypothetical protein
MENSLTKEISLAVKDALDLLLSMTQKAGTIRRIIRNTGFLLIWFTLAIYQNPWPNWQQDILIGFSIPEALFPLLQRFSATFLAFNVLPHIGILILAYFFAFRNAAIFVADVFEQKPDIAQRFLRQAAFSAPTYDTIHISEGRLDPKNRNSHIAAIGGPGLVQVNLENLAIFEKTDGSVNIIGPTNREPNNVHVLEGFERFKESIDLRDHVIKIDDVQSRTRDGIPVRMRNIRLLFSVKRSSKDSTLSDPYPFDLQAIRRLVYQQGPRKWTQVMKGLVISQLTEFIAKHKLAELLAAIGEPEVKKQIIRDRQIQNQIWKLRQIRKHTPNRQHYYRLRTVKPANQPKCIHPKHQRGAIYLRFNGDITGKQPLSIIRPQITNLFYQDFIKEISARRGVNLSWIDVGILETPSEIIPNQNLEAWEISNENILRSNALVLQQLQLESRLHELTRLVRELPINAVYNLPKSEGENPEAVIYQLLDAYAGTLQTSCDQNNINSPVRKRVLAAINQIRRYQKQYVKNHGHWISGNGR